MGWQPERCCRVEGLALADPAGAEPEQRLDRAIAQAELDLCRIEVVEAEELDVLGEPGCVGPVRVQVLARDRRAIRLGAADRGRHPRISRRAVDARSFERLVAAEVAGLVEPLGSLGLQLVVRD